MRDRDAPLDAGGAGQQLEIQRLRFGDVAKDRCNGDTPRDGGFGHRGKPT
jgi:hypothetical protein